MINATGTTFLLLCCSAAAWLNTHTHTQHSVQGRQCAVLLESVAALRVLPSHLRPGRPVRSGRVSRDVGLRLQQRDRPHLPVPHLHLLLLLPSGIVRRPPHTSRPSSLILMVEIAVCSYLDAVLPKQFGVSKKPWFFLTPIIKLFRRSTGSSAVGRYVTRSLFSVAL